VPIQNQMKPLEVSFASARYWMFTRTDQSGNGASRVASEEARRFNPPRLPRLEHKSGHTLPANRAIKDATHYFDPTNPDILGREVGGIRTGLFMPNDTYEMFVFGASSIVAAIGAIGGNSLTGTVFSGSSDLRTVVGSNGGVSKFNRLNTGHIAQFVHAFANVRSYWTNITTKIK